MNNVLMVVTLVMTVIVFIQSLEYYQNIHNDTFLSWESFDKFNDYHGKLNSSETATYIQEYQILASQKLKSQKVYISLTTIHSRLYGLCDTIESIVQGTVLPDHIYIILSKDPFLLDEGVTEETVMTQLSNVLVLKRSFPFISVIFTQNIGPHRKLLPLLRQKWDEDCVIITIDDHEIYSRTAIAGLIQYYVSSAKDAVIALRSRRMSFCRNGPPWHISPYTNKNKHRNRGLWPESMPGLREYLTLPTGTAGKNLFIHCR